MCDVLCHLAINTYTLEATTYTITNISRSSEPTCTEGVGRPISCMHILADDSRTFNLVFGSTKAAALRICIGQILTFHLRTPLKWKVKVRNDALSLIGSHYVFLVEYNNKLKLKDDKTEV